MPVIIPNNLPAKKVLSKENVFVMTRKRAKRQDIRPLRILILNLMPNKIVTETQFLRLLSNTPLQLEVTLIHMKSHQSKNTAKNHLDVFYTFWENVKEQRFDGMIITGAPVEHIEFEAVDYWDELCQILDWAKTNVYSALFVCWGAQAALYYYYGIQKFLLKEKMFGVFPHRAKKINAPLFKGFDDIFFMPHSRHTKNQKSDIAKAADLEILAESREAGASIIQSKDKRQIFITGHFEYDRDSLKDEYIRDKNKGLEIKLPENYFLGDDVNKKPIAK